MQIEVSALSKSFKNTKHKKQIVLDRLNFKLEPSSVTGFVGSNGSGKTTTIKCLLGFIMPDSGHIHYNDIPQWTRDLKSQIGYLPERPYYYEFMTAQEFLLFHWRLNGRGKNSSFKEAMEQALHQVDLKGVEAKSLREFSKGMLQRIGIAQAILCRPQFLILDEPMSGLDPEGRSVIKKVLHEEKAKGTQILMSSHLLSDVEELCTHLLIIEKGKIIYTGNLQDLIYRFETQYKVIHRSISPSNRTPKDSEWVEHILNEKELRNYLVQLSPQEQILHIGPERTALENAYDYIKREQEKKGVQ